MNMNLKTNIEEKKIIQDQPTNWTNKYKLGQIYAYMLVYVEMYFNKYTDFKEKLCQKYWKTVLLYSAYPAGSSECLSGKALFIDI